MALTRVEKSRFEDKDATEQNLVDVRFRARTEALLVRDEADFLREAFQVFRDYLKHAAETRVGGAIEFYADISKIPTQVEKTLLNRWVAKRTASIAAQFSNYCRAHAEIGLDRQILESMQDQLEQAAHEQTVRSLATFENFAQIAKRTKGKVPIGKADPYEMAQRSKAIEKVRTSDGNEYDLFPFALHPSELFFNIEEQDIKTPDDLHRLILLIYQQSEASFYYYTQRDGPGNWIMEDAFNSNKLNRYDFEYGFYPDKRYVCDYVRLNRFPEYEMREWQRKIVDEHPEHIRIRLRLTEAQRREIDQTALINKLRASESDMPLNFKPKFLGVELDGLRAVEFLRRHWPRIKKIFER